MTCCAVMRPDGIPSKRRCAAEARGWGSNVLICSGTAIGLLTFQTTTDPRFVMVGPHWRAVKSRNQAICHAFGIYRSRTTQQTDKLHSLRLKPTLCDPNPLCRSAALTAEPWVSVDQIAEHLGVTRDSIYRWIDRKGLPAHRVGRLWKFQMSEVDDWVRAGGANEEKEHE